jgi:hypothetical protein
MAEYHLLKYLLGISGIFWNMIFFPTLRVKIVADCGSISSSEKPIGYLGGILEGVFCPILSVKMVVECSGIRQNITF